jgi:hypothetical protein
MKTFQQKFIEDLESSANSLDYELVAEWSASNCGVIHFIEQESTPYTSQLTMEFHFQRNHNVFNWDKPILDGKSNPRMAIINSDNIGEAREVIDAILFFLSH